MKTLTLKPKLEGLYLKGKGQIITLLDLKDITGGVSLSSTNEDTRSMEREEFHKGTSSKEEQKSKI